MNGSNTAPGALLAPLSLSDLYRDWFGGEPFQIRALPSPSPAIRPSGHPGLRVTSVRDARGAEWLRSYVGDGQFGVRTWLMEFVGKTAFSPAVAQQTARISRIDNLTLEAETSPLPAGEIPDGGRNLKLYPRAALAEIEHLGSLTTLSPVEATNVDQCIRLEPAC